MGELAELQYFSQVCSLSQLLTPEVHMSPELALAFLMMAGLTQTPNVLECA